MKNYFEHLFVYFPCMSFVVKHVFKSFAHFIDWILCFLIVRVLEFLICFGYKSCITYVLYKKFLFFFYKKFLSIGVLSFHSPSIVF